MEAVDQDPRLVLLHVEVRVGVGVALEELPDPLRAGAVTRGHDHRVAEVIVDEGHRRRMKARISSSLSSASVTTRFRRPAGGMSTTSPSPRTRPTRARRPESTLTSPVKFGLVADVGLSVRRMSPDAALPEEGLTVHRRRVPDSLGCDSVSVGKICSRRSTEKVVSAMEPDTNGRPAGRNRRGRSQGRRREVRYPGAGAATGAGPSGPTAMTREPVEEQVDDRVVYRVRLAREQAPTTLMPSGLGAPSPGPSSHRQRQRKAAA